MASSNNRTIVTRKPEFIVNPEDKSIRKGKTTWVLPNNEFYKSAKEAARECRIPYHCVISNLNHRCKTTHNMLFIYADEVSYRLDDVGSYVMEFKAHADAKVEDARKAEERAARAEAEAQRFKEIWHSVQNSVNEAFVG